MLACLSTPCPRSCSSLPPSFVPKFLKCLLNRAPVEVGDIEDGLRVPTRLPLLGEERLQPAADEVVQEGELCVEKSLHISRINLDSTVIFCYNTRMIDLLNLVNKASLAPC